MLRCAACATVEERPFQGRVRSRQDCGLPAPVVVFPSLESIFPSRDECHTQCPPCDLTIRIMDSQRTFFVMTVTWQRLPIFRLEARARLLIEVCKLPLRRLVHTRKSTKLREGIDAHNRVLNARNVTVGVSRRRGDGTFGELVPSHTSISVRTRLASCDCVTRHGRRPELRTPPRSSRAAAPTWCRHRWPCRREC